MSSVQGASFGERNFKYLLVGPAIFVLLLIGVFPLVYLLMVSFQGITMTETSTDFIGAANYKQLFDDARLWQALLHTLIITAIALPLELVLGLTMAQLFLDRLPGRAIFIALLVLPVVVSPIVSVIVPGPPCVSAHTMSNRRKRSSPRIRIATVMTGAIAGSTMREKVRHQLAPSMAAASSCERSTLPSAASSSRNMNGVHCQISAAMMAGYTRSGLMVHSRIVSLPAIQPMI